MVTFEHFYETGILMEGYEDRIEYLHGFPGTVWSQINSITLVKHSVLWLLDASGGPPVDPLSLDFTPLVWKDLLEVEKEIKGYSSILEPILATMAVAEQMSRQLRKGQTKKEQLSNEREFAAFLSKGPEIWHRQLSQIREDGGAPNLWEGDEAKALLAQLASALERHGLLAMASSRIDPIFSSLVLPHLPPEIARNPESVKALQKLWSNQKRRAELTPSLACVATVDEELYRNPEQKFEESDILDSMHVAYASLVDNFTCDKRNVGPVEKAIKLSGAQTRVFRTKRLDEVAQAVEEVVKVSGGLPSSQEE